MWCVFLICVLVCALVSFLLIRSYALCSVVCRCFFFKQKTAYEMRISDWSSDVCSSDLKPRDDVATQAGVTSRWLALRTQVTLGDGDLTATSLIDAWGGAPAADAAPPAIIRRDWDEGECSVAQPLPLAGSAGRDRRSRRGQVRQHGSTSGRGRAWPYEGIQVVPGHINK